MNVKINDSFQNKKNSYFKQLSKQKNLKEKKTRNTI